MMDVVVKEEGERKRPRQNRSASKKVVLVTGVSRGLGRALAVEMASRGHTVVGCARDPSQLQQQLDSLAPGRHLLIPADVSSDASVAHLATTVIQTKGVPHIIVNNAGIINKRGKLWEIPADEFDLVIDINLKGTANILRHFLPPMIAKKRGIIVNFSSGWGRSAAAEVSPYCASKWAIEGLTKSVAMEVPQGIAVVSFNPGLVNTPLLASCFGAYVTLYERPETWAVQAATKILGLTTEDNGVSLNAFD